MMKFHAERDAESLNGSGFAWRNAGMEKKRPVS